MQIIEAFEQQPDSYLGRMLGQEKPESSTSLEKAKLIAAVFGKKTSVVFDIRAICDLFCKEGLKDETKITLANLLHISLAMSLNNMSLPLASKVIFQKYWELGHSTLTLSKLNELIQANRDN